MVTEYAGRIQDPQHRTVAQLEVVGQLGRRRQGPDTRLDAPVVQHLIVTLGCLTLPHTRLAVAIRAAKPAGTSPLALLQRLLQ
jgi:hypothetical protein